MATRSVNVLVTDDSFHSLEVLAKRVRQSGLQPVLADPHEPVATAQTLWKDDPSLTVAVVDLCLTNSACGETRDLPEVGIGLVRWLRQTRPEARIAVVTSFPRAGDAELLRAAGATAYCDKTSRDSLAEFLQFSVPAYGEMPEPTNESAGATVPLLDEGGAPAESGRIVPNEASVGSASVGRCPKEEGGSSDSADRPPADDHDRAWHDLGLRKRHCGQTVALDSRALREAGRAVADCVLGAGRNIAEAAVAAEKHRNYPGFGAVLFVPLPLFVPRRDLEYDWCFDEEVRREHGGLIAAMHGRRVLASGNDREEAWQRAAARPGCPPEDEVAFVLFSCEPEEVLG